MILHYVCLVNWSSRMWDAFLCSIDEPQDTKRHTQRLGQLEVDLVSLRHRCLRCYFPFVTCTVTLLGTLFVCTILYPGQHRDFDWKKAGNTMRFRVQAQRRSLECHTVVSMPVDDASGCPICITSLSVIIPSHSSLSFANMFALILRKQAEPASSTTTRTLIAVTFHSTQPVGLLYTNSRNECPTRTRSSPLRLDPQASHSPLHLT